MQKLRKRSMIKEAEGQAEAVLKVQKANAEGIRMIKEAGADKAVLTFEELWKHLQRQQTAKQPRSLFLLRSRE